ncbi:MAG: PLP-dependent aminotransferase family protein [Clostridiales bacterium]|nr:PLP-dependent aminotransferase family protein [Clostridiales bacterium]
MLIVPLDTQSSVPLYEQIYQYLKNEIKIGKLSVATKLPSTRGLSSNLQISRSTVELAYSQLISEGYIESRPKSGYYVAKIGDLVTVPERLLEPKSRTISKQSRMKYDFNPFTVDMNGFPFATWRRISNQCMNDMNQQLFLLGDSQGDLSLREAIGRYLHSSRGVNVAPEQIIIGAGTDYLLQLLVQILRPIHAIGMENPSYKRAYQIFNGLGVDVEAIDVKKDGIDLVQLANSQCELCYVTPSHQYPLGVVMPINKRLELLSWASEKENRYIIEDDHDSEFRYKGKPIPSLQGIDQKDCVIYIGTFSRAIAPAIRMGYMVLPKTLVNRYREKFSYYASTVSRIDQAIMCEFINGGFFERHVNKMRTRYKSKHDTLLRALKIFRDQIRVTGEYAGLHLVVEFLVNMTEEELLALAKTVDVQLYGLQRHYLDERKNQFPTVLIGFADLSESQIEEGIQLLYECLKQNKKEYATPKLKAKKW